nr:two-component regulator propeller domain-containing protein [uncultured Arsenicibacter sp.]
MKHVLLIISFILVLSSTIKAQPYYFSRLTSEHGLAHNSVFSIAQDYKGFMWFGTRDGVSRYDGQKIRNYSFTSTHTDVEHNRANCVYAAGKKLWAGTTAGLYAYDIQSDRFLPVPLEQKATHIHEIKQMASGVLWLATRNGIFLVYPDGRKRHILAGQSVQTICEYRKGTYLILTGNQPRIINEFGESIVSVTVNDVGQEKLPSFRNYTFFKDRHGVVWLGTNAGLLWLDETIMAFHPIPWYQTLIKNSIRVIRTMTEDQHGNFWLGSESGVVMITPDRKEAKHIDRSFAEDLHSLSDRAVYSSYVARDGTVWFGTYFGGVNFTQTRSRPFNHMFANADGQGLAGKAVSELVVDAQKKLWIASEDGGISVLDPQTGRYTFHNRRNGLSDDNVHGLYIDKRGIVWAGTYLGGLNRIDPKTGAKTVYMHREGDSTSLLNDGVYTILCDRRDRYWIGTVRGLNLFDAATGKFQVFRPDMFQRVFIYNLLEDSAGMIWITTRFDGIFRYNPDTGNLTRYHTGNTPVLHSNQVISIYEDSRHNMWFGLLNGGVYQWDRKTGRVSKPWFNTYLPNKTVYGILEDRSGHFWFSTNSGLFSVNPKQDRYHIFDKSNGLQTTQFNFRSYLKDQQGRLYFGSVNGLCYFDPDSVSKHTFDPPVYFTDFKLFNKTINPARQQVLTRPLDETPEIRLAYSQNVITLDFVAINYQTRQNYYSCYLEGFEETWGPKTTINSQTYTNLSPGEYTFHVRSYQSNGQLSPKERTLTIIVDPPFWRSGYAYLLYTCLLIGALLLYRRFITLLNNQKLEARMARARQEKSEELNQQKLNFFTFLSNEFKTPITLIMAEIDELIRSNQAWRNDSATNYKVIKKNARRLQSLIDQITELRKVGNEHQKLVVSDQDIVLFLKEVVQGVDPLLQSRQIGKRLTFQLPFLMASFDAGKLEMLVGNLYFLCAHEVPEGSTLAVDVKVEQQSAALACQLVIRFSFSGAPDLFALLKSSYEATAEDEKLFTYSNSSSISLALTFSLLKVLSGQADFDENGMDYGLTVAIPIRKSPVSKPAPVTKKADPLLLQVVDEPDDLTPAAAEEAGAATLPTLLIADRSKDLTQFLKRHFQEKYRVQIVHSYADALKKAEAVLPEIIICENDLQQKASESLCQALKKNPLTESIPVILLLNDQDDSTIINALNCGADGYIAKPFNLKELDLIVKNELSSVALLKKKLTQHQGSPLLHPLPKTNKEQAFMLRFSELVISRYKDKDITTESLAQHMHCSRSQLHTKLTRLTGLSPKEYVNEYRLSVARQELLSGKSVGEVTFDVGFSDPNYFSRAFKKKFGISPSKINVHETV